MLRETGCGKLVPDEEMVAPETWSSFPLETMRAHRKVKMLKAGAWEVGAGSLGNRVSEIWVQM